MGDARVAAALVCTAALSACGGGGSSTTAEGVAAPSAHALDAIDAQGGVDAGWTRVAVEHEAFSVPGTQTVRYGVGSNWITKTVSGGGDCSNEWFGSDPAVGIVKACEVGSAASTEAGWARVAAEGDAFAVSGMQTVRYGSGSAWLQKTVANGGQCSNEWFGGDPLVGVVKACEVSSVASTEAGWARVAGEGEAFAVSGTQTVRYGSGSAWLQKTVESGGQCSNEWFGGDPLVGVVKQCEVTASAGAAAGTSTSTSTGTGTVARGRRLHAAGRRGRHRGRRAERRRRHAGELHRGGAACRDREPRRRHVQLRRRPRSASRSSSPIDVPTERDTVIDGGGKVTLDGGGTTRILSLVRADYRTNSNGLTLQRIALVNGRAPGTGYVPQDPAAPHCAWGYAERRAAVRSRCAMRACT